MTLLEEAATFLARLGPKFGRQVRERIERLADDPRPDGWKPLKGNLAGLHRVRQGPYRIFYEVRDDQLLVLVISIDDRKDAYR